MARARNIKPGFFTNEDLCELPPLTRLLFIGLWTEADREGRLEDRPSRLKMRVFPMDTFDVDEALSRLAEKNFITRYEVGGQRLIQISAWHKHQRPHAQEAKSVLPEQKSYQGCISDSKTEDFRNENTTLVVSPPRKSEIFESKIALIPDTGYLIPDSGERERETSALARLPRPPYQALPLDQDPQADLRELAEDLVQQLSASGDAHLTYKALERDFGHSVTFAGDSSRYVASVRERARIWCAAWNENSSLTAKKAQYWIGDGDYARNPPPPRQRSGGMTRLIDLFPEVPDASE